MIWKNVAMSALSVKGYSNVSYFKDFAKRRLFYNLLIAPPLVLN